MSRTFRMLPDNTQKEDVTYVAFLVVLSPLWALAS